MFQAGDHVFVVSDMPRDRMCGKESFDPTVFTPSKQSLLGRELVIADTDFIDNAPCGDPVYYFKACTVGEYTDTSEVMWCDDDFEPVDCDEPDVPLVNGGEYDGHEYDVRVMINDELLVLRLYEDGHKERTEHAHIFHAGIGGVIQALSYAARKIYREEFEEEKK